MQGKVVENTFILKIIHLDLIKQIQLSNSLNGTRYIKGVIVYANTEKEARLKAKTRFSMSDAFDLIDQEKNNPLIRYPDLWLDPSFSSCIMVKSTL